MTDVELRVVESPEEVAQGGAVLVARKIEEAVDERGRCLLALSGGHTPWAMLAHVAERDLPWDRLHLFQVDERVAPAGDPDRNLTHLQESLLSRVPVPDENVHAIPVEEPDVDDAVSAYAATLTDVAGSPAVLDLIHLGLGPDGHTASLVPGDPVLDVVDVDVAATAEYQGHRRVTVTYPVLDRARRILYLVTGAEKRTALARLLVGDPGIPAGRVRPDRAIVLADTAAAGDGT